MLRFRCDHVANTLSVTTNRDRASPPLAGSPTEQRLTALHSRSPPQRTYGLLQTRPHGSFAAQPAALKPPGQFRAAPLPHRCRVPSVRAPGQDFHLRSQHPYSAHQPRPAAWIASAIVAGGCSRTAPSPCHGVLRTENIESVLVIPAGMTCLSDLWPYSVRGRSWRGPHARMACEHG